MCEYSQRYMRTLGKYECHNISLWTASKRNTHTHTEWSQMLLGSLLMQSQRHLTLFMERRTLNMKACESWKALPESEGDQN